MVYTGNLDASGEVTLELGIDTDDMPMIQAWAYSDSDTAYIFGRGWYRPAVGIKGDGELKIKFTNGAGASYRVIIVE
jgi:hypothetical protein